MGIIAEELEHDNNDDQADSNNRNNSNLAPLPKKEPGLEDEGDDDIAFTHQQRTVTFVNQDAKAGALCYTGNCGFTTFEEQICSSLYNSCLTHHWLIVITVIIIIIITVTLCVPYASHFLSCCTTKETKRLSYHSLLWKWSRNCGSHCPVNQNGKLKKAVKSMLMFALSLPVDSRDFQLLHRR